MSQGMKDMTFTPRLWIFRQAICACGVPKQVT